MAELPLLLVAAIRWRRRTHRVWPTKFRIFPRVAALLWNFSADASCRVWKRSPTNHEFIETTSRDCGQLEDVQDTSRDARVLLGLCAAGLGRETLRYRRRSAVHGDLRRGRM